MRRHSVLTIVTALLIMLFSYTSISKLAALQIFHSQLAMQIVRDNFRGKTNSYRTGY